MYNSKKISNGFRIPISKKLQHLGRIIGLVPKRVQLNTSKLLAKLSQYLLKTKAKESLQPIETRKRDKY